jgi:CubicO group peptidase (beta-lactamase class C family)
MIKENQLLDALQAHVEAGRLAGASMLVWRRGELLEAGSAGFHDLERRQALKPDALFRIASMSKPITSALALMLFERGRFALEDPITRWAPELSTMRVLRSPSGALDDTVLADRSITFEDLLTQRSGITYGGFWPGPLAKAYDEALGGDIDSDVAPDRWIENLGHLPLIDQPGATLHYGHSTDLLGLLLARMENKPLGDLLEEYIFSPLGMNDTHFLVPRDKRDRRALAYGFDEHGRMQHKLSGPGGSFLAERPENMQFVSGGQGLWSTVQDYLAFARIFVNRGAPLLRPETIEMMTSNRLTPKQRESAEVGGMPLFVAGHGYGLGVAVVLEPERAMTTICGGNTGAVGWPGGFGGWWQADPSDGSIAVFLAHNLVEREQLSRGIGLGIYAAISEFQRLAAQR